MQPCTCSLAPQVPSIEELIQKAKTYVAAAKAPATLKASETTGASSSLGAVTISRIRFPRRQRPLPSTLRTVPPPCHRAPSPAGLRRLPRRIRPRASATRLPRPAILS
jgi:hypothetical protein